MAITLGHKLDASTLALWRLDEASGSSNAADATGSYNAPAVNSGGFPSPVPALIADGGGAKRFNGGFYNPTGNAAMATALLGEWTIEAWINLDSLPSGIDARIVDVLDGPGSKRFVWFSVTQFGALEVFWQGAANQNFDGLAGAIAAGTRYHVGARKTSLGGGNYRVDLFINGVKVSASGSLPNSTAASLTTAVFGSGSGGAPFTGIIDDLRISKIARTDAEISDSYWRGLLDTTPSPTLAPFRQSRTPYQDAHRQLSPTAFLQPNGAAFEAAQGSVKDALFDRCLQAVKAKYPNVAPADALASIGADRMMPRGGSESDAAYAARLLNAWNTWPWAGTPYGVLQAFYSTGYRNVVLAQVRGGKQFTLDNGGTNLLQFSQNFENAAWSKGFASIVPNATTAPDGTTTAAKLVEDGTNNIHFLGGQTPALTAGTRYIKSVWAKGSGRNLELQVRTLDGTFRYGIFDLTNGVVGDTFGLAASGMLALGGGVYRCSIVVDAGTGATGNNEAFILTTGTTKASEGPYLGNGVSGVFLWGAQTEAVAASATTPSDYSRTFAVAKPTALAAGSLVTSTMGNGIWETDPLSAYSPANQSFWSKFDVLFPLPLMPPSWGWSGGIPSSSSAEANFIRALIQAWKPAHATCNRIVIVQQGNVLGYPASRALGASNGTLGGSAATYWTP